jgi:hypothetical protein
MQFFTLEAMNNNSSIFNFRISNEQIHKQTTVEKKIALLSNKY